LEGWREETRDREKIETQNIEGETARGAREEREKEKGRRRI
jgi:hypothetical protein